jgi:transcription-repair coupling factor (superfamily II helicase)
VRRDEHVELGVDSFILRSYVPSDRQWMEIYRRLAQCANRQDIEQLTADLGDAYGTVPPEVQTMLDLAEIRVRAGELGVQSIILMDPDIILPSATSSPPSTSSTTPAEPSACRTTTRSTGGCPRPTSRCPPWY